MSRAIRTCVRNVCMISSIGDTPGRAFPYRCLIRVLDLASVSRGAGRAFGSRFPVLRTARGSDSPVSAARRASTRPGTTEARIPWPSATPRHPSPSAGDRRWSRSRCPTACPEIDGLTVRQRIVLDMIRTAIETRGYPPSMREIGDAVGLTSPSSVAYQLARAGEEGLHPPRPEAARAPWRSTTPPSPTTSPTSATRCPRRSTCRSSAASPPAGRSSPSRRSRRSSRCPSRSWATASCSCSRSSASR